MHEFIKDDDTCGFMRNKCSGGGVCVCVCGEGGEGVSEKPHHDFNI